MKKGYHITLIMVILNGMCAVLGTINAILEIVLQSYRDSVFLFVLHFLCAAAWIYIFLSDLKSYRSDKKER